MSLVLKKMPEVKGVAAYQNGDIKNDFSLAEHFKDKWGVLFFYPLDFTFVCPTELQAFATAQEAFKKEGAELAAVSIDSAFSHKAWFTTDPSLKEVKYPVIADLNKKVSRDFGVLDEEKGFALRGTFIIDPKGVVQYQVVAAPSLGRNTEETIRSLQALKTGEKCPANWKPGQKTLGK
jgi:peroxiredoxin (alkyl hydroperoxide reductase subunit C)